MNGLFLWYLLELNQGHMDFQSIALPPELRHQCKSECKDITFLPSLQIFRYFSYEKCTRFKNKCYLCSRKIGI